MRRRDAGWILIAAGVLCGVAYTLINLIGADQTVGRGGNLMLYAGIFLLIAGLVVLGASRVRRGGD
jgi:hypothetical protein